MIVGLTGGIGSGKSVVGHFFTELGIDVIDADHVSKNILDENESAKKLFVEHFGDKFIAVSYTHLTLPTIYSV